MNKEKKLSIPVIVAIVLAVTTLLFAGLFVYMLVTSNAAGAEAPAQPKLRAYNGNVQWYDGASWHTSTSLEALSAEDPFAAQQELPTAALFAAPALTRAGGSVATTTYTGTTRKPTSTTTTTTNNDSNNTQNTQPSAPAEQPAAPAPTEPVGGSTTGDGEDMQWSGDIL